jgi:hypothetical protein
MKLACDRSMGTDSVTSESAGDLGASSCWLAARAAARTPSRSPSSGLLRSRSMSATVAAHSLSSGTGPAEDSLPTLPEPRTLACACDSSWSPSR